MPASIIQAVIPPGLTFEEYLWHLKAGLPATFDDVMDELIEAERNEGVQHRDSIWRIYEDGRWERFDPKERK